MSAGLEEPCLPLPDRKAKEGQVGRNKPISINLGAQRQRLEPSLTSPSNSPTP
jgi:hypothetical protein